MPLCRLQRRLESLAKALPASPPDLGGDPAVGGDDGQGGGLVARERALEALLRRIESTAASRAAAARADGGGEGARNRGLADPDAPSAAAAAKGPIPRGWKGREDLGGWDLYAPPGAPAAGAGAGRRASSVPPLVEHLLRPGFSPLPGPPPPPRRGGAGWAADRLVVPWVGRGR